MKHFENAFQRSNGGERARDQKDRRKTESIDWTKEKKKQKKKRKTEK